MKALVVQRGVAAVRDDLPEPPPRADETPVAVLTAGVCATDLALARGYMGFAGVPGHEFVGRALDGPLAGRRVVGEINAGCGRCAACASGDARHCPDRTVLGILGRAGCLAERLALPTRNLLAVPDAIPDDAAVFAEPLAAACRITEQLDVAGARVLVAGDGRLGLPCAWTLHLAGATVTVAGRHPGRARLLPPGVPHVTGWLEAAGDGGGASGSPARAAFDVAVEATGQPDVLPRLSRCVRPGGTVVLKTTSELPATLDLAPIVVDELTLLGSRCGRFEPALALLAAGRIPVRELIAGRFPLARADEALACAARRGVLKVLVDVAPR